MLGAFVAGVLAVTLLQAWTAPARAAGENLTLGGHVTLPAPYVWSDDGDADDDDDSSGYVIDTDNRAAGLVLLINPDGSRVEQTVSVPNPNGNVADFSFTGLDADTYSIRFATWGGNSPFAGQTLGEPTPIQLTTDRTNLSVTLAVGATISGSIDPKISGCDVEAYAPNNALPLRSTKTDADGHFTLMGLSNSDVHTSSLKYFLRVRTTVTDATDPQHLVGCDGPNQYYDPSDGKLKVAVENADGTPIANGVAVAPLPPTPGAIPGKLTYVHGGSIRGTITTTNGGNLKDIPVQVYSATGTYLASGVTTNDGSYQIDGVLPGIDRVLVVNRSLATSRPDLAPKIRSGKSETDGFALGARITVEESKLDLATSYDEELDPADAATYVGSLVGPDTQPLGNCDVRAVDPTGVRLGRSTRSDVADGTFTLSGLTPGSFEIEVEPTGDCEEGVTQYIAASGKLTPDDYLTSTSAANLGSPTDLGALVYDPDLRTPIHLLTAPTISGYPIVNGTLSATGGTWSVTEPVTTYQWFVDGAAVTEDSDNPNLELRPAWVGRRVTVQVVVSTYKHAPGTVMSAATAPVAPDANIPRSLPVITGTPQVGQMLRVKPASLDIDPDSATYRWLRNGKAIRAATKSSYKLTKSDRLKSITVEVTYNALGYTSQILTSPPVGVEKVLIRTKPTVKGKLKVGSSLSVGKANISPAKTKAKFQWYSGSKAIKGATKAKYRLTKADRRKRISVKVTYTRTGYKAATVKVKASAIVR